MITRYFGSTDVITFLPLSWPGDSESVLPSNSVSLSGTTLRVYRYLFRQAGKPVGVHEVQSVLGLSSPSVAHYHIRKLVEDGFVREGPGGYVVDRVLFENMLRVRNSIIPFQTTFLTIFLSSLILTLTVFRAPVVSGEYLFALSMNLVAVGIFSWETFRTIRPKRI